MNQTEARFLIDRIELVERTTNALKSGENELAIRQRLEREWPPELCRALLDCSVARLRFAHKLYDGDRWLLSGTAGEQASAWQVAEWRADYLGRLFPQADLLEIGCGVGGDTGFLSRHFQVRGFEMDLGRATLCPYNVGLIGRPDRLAIHAQQADLENLEGNLLFCDPARRSHKRLSGPEEWSPPLSQVLACYRGGRFGAVAVKCAPGLDTDEMELPRENTAVTFLSLDGELKECLLLLGTSAPDRAGVLLRSKSSPLVYRGRGKVIPARLPEQGLFLHNPDPAILRAEALDSLAEELGAGQPHPLIGYLVGATPCTHHASQSFLILESFALKWAHLKKRVASMDWTEFEYLGRGVPFSQTDVRAKLPKLKSGKKNSKRGAVIIYRDHDGYTAVLGERVRA